VVGDSGHGFDGDKELINRLKNVEDNFTERKPDGVKPDEIRKTIVAFSNSVPEDRTGVLYIGIRDNGDIQGVSNSDSLQKTIRNICEKDCYPPVRPRIEVLSLEGRFVIGVVVPESRNRPHFSGPAYVRIGSESIVASEKLFQELITDRLGKPHEILKWKEKIVTVVAQAKKLGDTENLHDSSYHATHECRVEECTPHYVSLFEISTGKHLSEPLENVILARDEKRQRLMLIVKERS
jgi:predicted HTH transcriptional regulator